MRSSQTSLFAPVRSANAQSALRFNSQAPLQASLTGSFALPPAYFVRCQNYIWEIFRVVVYCSVIKVLRVVVQTTALIDYHIFRRLSTTFLISFFAYLLQQLNVQATAFIDYHVCRYLSTTFLTFHKMYF